MDPIRSLVADIKPDSWASFYLFYFNQGLGSEAAFKKDPLMIYIFVGNLMTAENNGKIIDAIDNKHELAAGEFINILPKLSVDDLLQFKTSAGAVLIVNTQNGKASSTFFETDEEIKDFVTHVRSQGANQIH